VNRFITAWYRFVMRLTIWFGALAGVGLGALIVLTTLDVFLRAAFKAPIIGSVELSEVLIVFIALSWIAYTQAVKGHVSVELLVDHFPPKAKTGVNIAGCILGLSFAGLVVWCTVRQMVSILGQGRTTFLLHIPREIPLAFICLGFLLYALVTINSILQDLGIGKPEERIDG
jgi:TRAP-type C4-dicarboxylate transport system permease small subunit